MTVTRSAVLALCTLALLVLGAVPAFADPALPSNYVSQVTTPQPHPAVSVHIEGGDSYFVMEVEPGTQVLVPGYDDGRDLEDWAELEIYLRVQPDGTVQLNRNARAYYLNAARYGAEVPGFAGPEATPDWETVATDGRVAWHDHRIHFMSPEPPRQVDTDASEPQRVFEYQVPLVVDGELVVAEGTLDYVADGSPLPVTLLALLGLAAGVLLGRRDPRQAALVALVAGGVTAGLMLAATAGRAAGFDVATPPVALAAVGALAPLLGATVSSLGDGQRKGLLVLGSFALLSFGVLATGVLDGLLAGETFDGYGNWWLRPTLPADVAPGVLRLAIALGTGVGAGLLAAVLSEPDAELAALEAAAAAEAAQAAAGDPAETEAATPEAGASGSDA